MKYVYIKRDDEKFQGSVIDIPESAVAQTLKNHPTWKVMHTISDTPDPEPVEGGTAPMGIPEKVSEFKCPLCDYEASSKSVLARHKTSKHS